MCKIDCQGGDGKALAPWGQPRPVAAGGGLLQCQQYCDLAETIEPGKCVAVVYQAGPSGGLCSLVNVSAPTVDVLIPSMTYRRRPRELSGSTLVQADKWGGRSRLIEQWVVSPSDRVFEAARPWQTAFCTQKLTTIDWAAAPGTFVSMQLALLLHATRTGKQQTTTAHVSVSDLVSTVDDGTSSRIRADQVEMSQVGLVSTTSCTPTVCGNRAYSAELGPGTHWYPDLLQPLGSGYPTTLVLRANRTRGLYIGLRVPDDTESGIYEGTVTVKYEGGSSKSTHITLRVWPIDHNCLQS